LEHRLIDLLIALIRKTAVFKILAYLLTRLPFFGDILNRRFTGKNTIVLTLFFGAFSIYGTLSGIEIFGAMANFRDLGPTLAGLLAGPVVGVASGLIGGIYRYQLGGLTALPCAIAPVLAGLAGGILFCLKRGRAISIWEAVLLMVAMELAHAAVTLAICGAGREVMAIIRAVLFPMILANGAGIAVFVFMINNLVRERRTEEAKQRIDSELRIAREIQMSMVPKSRPFLPGDPGDEIYAVLKPAKEVGGDLYSFFPIDADRLCLAVGDVAGKGVPASLYMAITQKLIKAISREVSGPGELLSRLNQELCDGNDTLMFVTLFLCFFDRRTGEVVFSNGGHNPPYRVRTGTASMLVMDPGMALGIQPGRHYGERSLQLQGGETLFLYTDGVTEAMDARGNLYSEGRLESALIRFQALTPEAMCRELLADIGSFVGQNEQSDDITLLALRFNGAEGRASRSSGSSGG
jgi:sigma-B regulation protein RsbU (phosphoserine phosphatase)